MVILSNQARPAAVRTLQELGRNIADEARASAPVRTGKLRASIEAEDTNDGSKVSATATYAGFVEFGTRYMAGRGFLSRAVDRVIDALIRAYEETLR